MEWLGAARRVARGLLVAGVLLGAAAAIPSVARAQDSTATVTADGARLREAADINARIVATIPRGTAVTIKRRVGAWSEIEQGGRRGFMRSSLLGPATAVAGGPAPAPAPVTRAAEPAAAPPTRTEPAAAAPEPSVGEAPATARPRFSIEVGAFQQSFGEATTSGTDQEEVTDDEPIGSGIGFDGQLRLRFGALSLGAGYQRSTHDEVRREDGGELTGSFTWAGPFVEPRIELPLGSAASLFIGGRAARITGDFDGAAAVAGQQATFTSSTTGWFFAGGGGLSIHLSRRLALIGSGMIGQVRTTGITGSFSLPGVGEQTLDDSAYRSRARVMQFRGGLAIGF
jgi:hypothetical protein